ncbi:pantoate--beta-alanine ligase [Halobacillus sp. A1]|uniref:pantoate--beta-alanine ligase n=1 Tax=Halobacillus sp. A1 TaxID=2880262 RepID=UPI0020A626B1|nr:pantoate--beta-alanine ligase [Halobacillus sp. A1]MCP3030719.1 pantoate--beta-alanine ligase [Halobacillus sp. A1]
MDVFNSINDVKATISNKKLSGQTVGFVPTMGFLHEGHLKLIDKAKEENDIVVLSIFVNPLQFGENEDLDAYPRDEGRDLALAEKHGVDLVFFPTTETMYPQPLSLNISVVRRGNVLCGKSRPGHFEGVVTILTKLFNICQPDRAYFGRKDAQQVAVVDALIEDFNFPIELVAVDTVREADGLAKSSRNVNLSDKEREEAPSIQEALQYGKELIERGENLPAAVLHETRQFLENKTRGKIDYIELLSYPELEPLEKIDRQVILAIAVFYERARLIDNVILNEASLDKGN